MFNSRDKASMKKARWTSLFGFIMNMTDFKERILELLRVVSHKD